jgi:hypothetical protein
MRYAKTAKQKQGHGTKPRKQRLSAIGADAPRVQILPQPRGLPANSAAPPAARCRLHDGVLGDPDSYPLIPARQREFGEEPVKNQPVGGVFRISACAGTNGDRTWMSSRCNVL